MLRRQLAAILLVVASARAQSNTPPVVVITAPLDGQSTSSGDPVTFSASAHDAEDGDVGAGLAWTSSLDGPLGRGVQVTRLLRPGAHEIVASVVDREGLQGEARVHLTVVPPSLVFTATADTTVDAARPNAVLGAKVELTADATPVRQVLLRFTVPGSGPLRVRKAVVRLTVAAQALARSDTGGTLHLIADDGWSEDSTSYRRRPALDGPALARLGPVKSGQVVEIDVTPVIVTAGSYAFALTSDSTNAVKYRSREAASGRPELVLILDHPPSSSTATTPGEGDSGDRGYEDFAFGPGVEATENKATAQKPESKLWHHDGTWWAMLYRPEAGAHRIHRLETASQTWIDTGTAVDERAKSRQDVLWDGRALYVASRFDGTPAQNRLLRFHYTSAARSWTLDAGFPVDVPGGGTESMTIAKDGTGTLWLAYTLNARVWVAYTLGDDALWAPPFVVPVGDATAVALDDIAGVQALAGAVGVFWSNQLTHAFYLAVHRDGTPPAAWALETAAAGSKLADDHFNMKLARDGRLFVAVKTSRTRSEDTLVGLLVRAPDGAWSPLHPVTTVEYNPTRPLCLLDESARLVHVFYSPNQTNIYVKTSDLDTISFPGGSGAPFITSTRVGGINNPTSTKQSIGPETGLVVVAASSDSQSYWHEAITPAEPPADAPLLRLPPFLPILRLPGVLR
jgi:hypothetical protein